MGKKRLNSWNLRLIATVSMLLDHIAVAFIGEGIAYTVLRVIGRLAFPVFAFLIAEGYRHTGNKGRYALRLLILAVVSEIPYQMFSNGRLAFLGQNTVFTLLISFAGLYAIDSVTGYFTGKGLRKAARGIGATVGLFLSCAATYLLQSDYCITGPILVAVYCYLSGSVTLECALAAGSMLFYRCPVPIAQCIGAIFPVLTYNGEKGNGVNWFGYVFYPAHLVIILLLKITLEKFSP